MEIFSTILIVMLFFVNLHLMSKLEMISENIKQLKGSSTHMAADLTVLTAEVARATAVSTSAVVLINGLAAQIAEMKNDPVALQALADQLDAASDSLAAAVAANTVAEEEVVVEEDFVVDEEVPPTA
jgi:hypothetical protein